jgi:hypothetical protein
MTPNERRLTEMTRIIDKFKPDVVIDTWCFRRGHSYNIESYKLENMCRKTTAPVSKIVTDSHKRRRPDPHTR